MILVDTSIWIDHLHRSEATLAVLLTEAKVCTHPMIIGELALGALRDRTTILSLLSDLPSTPLATHAEVLRFVESHVLYGMGLSLVDAHLLAALRLSTPDRLWTRDHRLRVAADKLGVSADLPALAGPSPEMLIGPQRGWSSASTCESQRLRRSDRV